MTTHVPVFFYNPSGVTGISAKGSTVWKILHFDIELTHSYLCSTRVRVRHHADHYTVYHLGGICLSITVILGVCSRSSAVDQCCYSYMFVEIRVSIDKIYFSLSNNAANTNEPL